MVLTCVHSCLISKQIFIIYVHKLWKQLPILRQAWYRALLFFFYYFLDDFLFLIYLAKHHCWHGPLALRVQLSQERTGLSVRQLILKRVFFRIQKLNCKSQSILCKCLKAPSLWQSLLCRCTFMECFFESFDHKEQTEIYFYGRILLLLKKDWKLCITRIDNEKPTKSKRSKIW